MKTFFLRILPYVISIIVGAGFYFFAVYIEDDNLNSLIGNIAASFLSIPFIFICYEVVSEICNKDVKETMLEHTSFEINYHIINLLQSLRTLLNIKETLTKDNLDNLLNKDKKFIKTHFNPNSKLSDSFNETKQKLQDLIYKQSTQDVVPNDQVQTILNIVKETGIIAKELEHIKTTKNKQIAETSTHQLLQNINDWIDFCQKETLTSHHSFDLMK